MLLWFVNATGFWGMLSLFSGVAVLFWSIAIVRRARRAKDIRPLHPALLIPLVPLIPRWMGTIQMCFATRDVLSIHGQEPATADFVAYVIGSLSTHMLDYLVVVAPAFLTLAVGRFVWIWRNDSACVREPIETRL